MHWTILASSLLHVGLSASVPHDLEISVKDVTAPNIVNIHVRYPSAITHDLVFAYGKCDSANFDDIVHTIAKVSGGDIQGDDTRLVWVVPDDVSTGGCVSAWEQKQLIGQSDPLSLDRIIHAGLVKRDMIPMTNDSGIDAEGPWFNGVSLLKNKEIGAVNVKNAKSKCKFLRSSDQKPCLITSSSDWNSRGGNFRFDVLCEYLNFQ